MRIVNSTIQIKKRFIIFNLYGEDAVF